LAKRCFREAWPSGFGRYLLQGAQSPTMSNLQWRQGSNGTFFLSEKFRINFSDLESPILLFTLQGSQRVNGSPFQRPARLTGLSVRTIKRMAAEGQLKSAKTPGLHVRVARADLNKLLRPANPAGALVSEPDMTCVAMSVQA